MIKLKLLSFLMVLLVLPFSSALCELEDADIGSFTFNTCVNLWQTCPDCTFVNISEVIYPNTTVATSMVQMTKTGTAYNYSFCKTQPTGEYVYKTFGNSAANGVCTQNVKFEITPGGNIFLFMILALLSLLLLILAFVAENEWLGFLAGTLFIITGVYAMIYGVASLSSLYTRAIAFTFIGLGIIFEVAAGYKVAEQAKGFSSAG